MISPTMMQADAEKYGDKLLAGCRAELRARVSQAGAAKAPESLLIGILVISALEAIVEELSMGGGR